MNCCHLILPDRYQSSIVQQSNEHQHQYRHSKEVRPRIAIKTGSVNSRLIINRLHTYLFLEYGFYMAKHDYFEWKYGYKKESHKLKGRGDSICQEIPDSNKNTSSNQDSVNDGGEAGLREHDVRGGPRCVSRATLPLPHPLSSRQERRSRHRQSCRSYTRARASTPR